MIRIAGLVVAVAALSGCGITAATPEPVDTAMPPSAPSMDCAAAQGLVSEAMNADPSTLTGPDVRRHVLAADAVILANHNCFPESTVANALDAFAHEGLDPHAYGYPLG